MSLDAAVLREPQSANDAFSRALAADPAASILKHSVKIWAREYGIAEDDLSRLTDMVVEFAATAICACERKVQAIV